MQVISGRVGAKCKLPHIVMSHKGLEDGKTGNLKKYGRRNHGVHSTCTKTCRNQWLYQIVNRPQNVGKSLAAPKQGLGLIHYSEPCNSLKATDEFSSPSKHGEQATQHRDSATNT
jgi:hypothetical protein